MTADATAATVALLLGESAVSTLAGTHVYGSEAPDDPDFNGYMPDYAVVVQPAGGLGPADGSYVALDGQRLEVNSYGSTPYRARQMARAVHAVLKAVKRETVWDDESDPTTATLVHSYTPSGGFVALREPETRWPRVLRGYVCTYSETEISP